MVLRVTDKKSSQVYFCSSCFSSSESSKFGSLPHIKAALQLEETDQELKCLEPEITAISFVYYKLQLTRKYYSWEILLTTMRTSKQQTGIVLQLSANAV
jgi:hypothetical protein